MSTSESVQMAGMGDGASRARPLPEPLRLPLPPSRATFVDGGRASGSPVAAPAARTVEATETPCSVAFSVPASPSGLHLGACASVRSVAPPQPAEHQHQHAVAAPLPQLLNQARYHSQPALTIRTEEPPPLQRVRTVGWARLCGDFNYAAKILYFTSLFLYMSLVRVHLLSLFSF